MLENIITYTSNSTEQTKDFAKQLAPHLKPGDFIALYGQMGSGKTAFVKGLAQYFESNDEVTSPTFAIVNEYNGTIPVFHFDMYRIENEDDLYSTGFYDYFYRDGIIAAEWCENIPYALPESYIKVSFERGDDENCRIITVEKIKEN